MSALAQRCAEPCHVPALRALVFWMMKKAAESSQTRAAKDATTSGNGIVGDAESTRASGSDEGPAVKFARTIPIRQRRPAVADWISGVAVKSNGTLQRKYPMPVPRPTLRSALRLPIH